MEEGELKRWMDGADIIYISLGSLVRLNGSQLASLASALNAVANVRVLWKLPADTHHLLPSLPKDKFRIESWVPSQIAVLQHPNVKVMKYAF